MVNQDIIVLSYPYSSAYYWLLSSELNNIPIKSKFDIDHPYYNMYGGYFRTLFGRNPSKLIDEVVSLSLLYRDVYLSPYDIDMPKAHRWSLRWSMKYDDDEVGVKFDWKWRADSQQFYTEIPNLLKNNIILECIKKLRLKNKIQFLEDCITQIYISSIFNSPIIGCSNTLKILNTINQILYINVNSINSNQPKLQISGLLSYFNLSSLHFEINKLEEFIILKTNKHIKEYSKNFKTYLNSLPNGDLDEKFLYKAMLEAIETESIADKISGGLDISGTILNIAGLIPFVGSVTGIIGLATDVGEKGVNKIAQNNSWWSLAPEISKQFTKFRIEQKFKSQS